VAIGHGQMEPAELEKIIFDFVNYDYDVLLANCCALHGHASDEGHSNQNSAPD